MKLQVKCSLCGGTGKDGSCIRCFDGSEEIRRWHASRGLKIPSVNKLDSGYFRISFSRQSFAQFPVNFKGILSDEYIFQPEWNRQMFNKFEIV